MNEIGAIILAAGASTRMKQQKMVMLFGEKTIIETVIDKVVQTGILSIIVVLGADHEKIQKQIEKAPVQTCINSDYLNGMLSSVICGFQKLLESAKAIMIFLGDQPQIPSQAGKMVIETWRKTGKGIIIPTFNGRRGHPVLIESRFSNEIKKLDPQKGLRQLMEIYQNEIAEVECDFPEILRDIDTPVEYETEITINLNQ